jgi:hypothetical protein
VLVGGEDSSFSCKGAKRRKVGDDRRRTQKRGVSSVTAPLQNTLNFLTFCFGFEVTGLEKEARAGGRILLLPHEFLLSPEIRGFEFFQ